MRTFDFENFRTFEIVEIFHLGDSEECKNHFRQFQIGKRSQFLSKKLIFI